MNKQLLNHEIEKILQFATPLPTEFSGVQFGLKPKFDLDCSNSKNNNSNCYNLKLDSEDSLLYVLDRLIEEPKESKQAHIKDFLNSVEYDSTTTFYLQVVRHF